MLICVLSWRSGVPGTLQQVRVVMPAAAGGGPEVGAGSSEV